ncbi:hypothetical protein BGY98DRAFT_936358 [Russula aff. rugulosa BPL654]|nr:hypothetical protein BGY98DRAFT_936358 [Russula aff. rugulosa BPL654]
MAPSLKKALKAFIEGIPASKLDNFPAAPGTLYNDDDFRLDLQGLTRTAYNLQIQANKGSQNTSVRKAAPKSVAGVLRAFSSRASAEDVRKALLASAADGAMKEI